MKLTVLPERTNVLVWESLFRVQRSRNRSIYDAPVGLETEKWQKRRYSRRTVYRYTLYPIWYDGCVWLKYWVEWVVLRGVIYTLHPKATSLRMHSMRKRRVTIKFTTVKVSNRVVGASWYYKIHPTHKRNTSQDSASLPAFPVHSSPRSFPFDLRSLPPGIRWSNNSRSFEFLVQNRTRVKESLER